MGVYASWFGEAFNVALRIARAENVCQERTLLVADFEPPRELIEGYLGGLPRAIALPGAPDAPLPGVIYGTFRTAANPLWFDDAIHVAFKHGVDAVALLCPISAIHGKTLLWLHERGVRRIIYPHRGHSLSASPKRLAFNRLLVNVPKKALERIGVRAAMTMTVGQCQNLIATAAPPRRSRGGPLKIAQFICALNSGGAERQVCYAAIGQKSRGHDVRVFCRQSPVGVDGHYRSLLAPHEILVHRIGSRWNGDFIARCHERGLTAKSLASLPVDLRHTVADLLGELLAWQPDVLHCYVDDCNIPGLIAGVLAGTPAVIASFRNGNPSLFPGLEMPWMKPWYQAMHRHPAVRFSSNSAGGARDYEAWLGWPHETEVIRNAFEPPPLPTSADAKRWRESLGIAADAPLVAGVFRLQEEKRPLHFVDCVDRLRRLVPNVRVVTAGVGEFEAAMREKIASLKLEQTILMLGQRRDVPTLLAASDVLLLVSSWEGTPNVALEAQYCGCVPVLTDVGGSREAIDPDRSGILISRDDIDAAVAAVAGLLRQPQRRAAMAEAGQAFVSANYSPEALTDANLRMYEEMLRPATVAAAS